ncbi:MAG: virulence factor TspB C-terminal domain-related protein, partial [Hylemonella sp.]
PTVPNTPDEPDSTTCAPPKLPGTVNGQTVCVDAGPSDPKQQTSNSSGTETKPDGTTVGTGTTSSTECTPTTCTTTTTTTTTTTPPGGSPTSQTTTSTGTCSRSSPGCGEEPGEDEPSSFGGTCGAAFACDGDAIMCAVALEQHKRNCALFVDASAESDLYNAEKGKTGTQYENENVALGPGSFNQSNALGAGAQCIQDRNITVMGNAITLPFSIICSTLQHFGSILIFISFLLAYRIVSRG